MKNSSFSLSGFFNDRPKSKSQWTRLNTNHKTYFCNLLTLSPPLNQAKIGGFGGLQFFEKGDEGIVASSHINHFVQDFTENPMVESAMF